MIELRVNYPGSVWGKLKTFQHKIIKHHHCHISKTSKGESVMYDDTCRIAWWV